MILNDTQWNSMLFNDIQWYSVICNDIQRYSMISNDTQWFTMIYHDIHWYTLTYMFGSGCFRCRGSVSLQNCQFHVQWTIPKSCVLTGVVFSQIPDLFFQIAPWMWKTQWQTWRWMVYYRVYMGLLQYVYIDGTIKQPFANHFKLWFIISSSLHPSAGDRWIW